MVQIIQPGGVIEDRQRELDRKALLIFNKCLDILGGPRKLFEYKRLTWLPSLMEAAYVVILSNEHSRTAKEIAEELGIATNTVRNIMNASPEAVEAKIKSILEGEELTEEKKTHTAGGLAKLAYERLKAEEEQTEGEEQSGLLS